MDSATNSRSESKSSLTPVDVQKEQSVSPTAQNSSSLSPSRLIAVKPVDNTQILDTSNREEVLGDLPSTPNDTAIQNIAKQDDVITKVPLPESVKKETHQTDLQTVKEQSNTVQKDSSKKLNLDFKEPETDNASDKDSNVLPASGITQTRKMDTNLLVTDKPRDTNSDQTDSMTTLNTDIQNHRDPTTSANSELQKDPLSGLPTEIITARDDTQYSVPTSESGIVTDNSLETSTDDSFKSQTLSGGLSEYSGGDSPNGSASTPPNISQARLNNETISPEMSLPSTSTRISQNGVTDPEVLPFDIAIQNKEESPPNLSENTDNTSRPKQPEKSETNNVVSDPLKSENSKQLPESPSSGNTDTISQPTSSKTPATKSPESSENNFVRTADDKARTRVDTLPDSAPRSLDVSTEGGRLTKRAPASKESPERARKGDQSLKRVSESDRVSKAVPQNLPKAILSVEKVQKEPPNVAKAPELPRSVYEHTRASAAKYYKTFGVDPSVYLSSKENGIIRDHKETGVTPLMLSVRENKLVVVERLLDLGCNVNDRAKDGRTALHYAASYARDDIIKLLLNRKADATVPGGSLDQLPIHMSCCRTSGALVAVQALLKVSGKDARLLRDKAGSIPLHLAAEVGNLAVCRELLLQNTVEQVKVQRPPNGDSAIHVACRRKDTDLVKLFIDYGTPLDFQNTDGHTALHLASWEGDEVLVKYLYNLRANPNVTDKFDRVPLHIAAERGHSHIVELLIDKFKTPIAARTKDGSTLMHIASQFGHPDTALTFLKKGVPLHMPNKSGAICLHAAAMKGHTAVVKALLQKGAVVDSKTKDGLTALHLAVEYCKPQVVQTLLGFGAAVELKGGQSLETPLHIAARTKDAERCAEMLLKSGADVNATKENGETVLHIAAAYGQLGMIDVFLEEGANPQSQSKAGETPLHTAAKNCHLSVTKKILEYCSEYRSHLDAVLLANQQNNEGETPLHYAAELQKFQAHLAMEDTDMIKLLLKYECDSNIQSRLTAETALHYCARAGNEDILLEIVNTIQPAKLQQAVNKQAKDGNSPLLVASEQGHLDIVKILLSNHARVDVFDEHGKAALHLAAENGHESVVEVLLAYKAFVNAKSKVGFTPLHLAGQNGYNGLVKLLIESHSAIIDALTLTKKTTLHLAAMSGKIEVCSTLLKMKSDANATDERGQTPLHLAAENDHSDVVKLFLKYRPELVTMASTDDNGMTCAHIAASKGSIAVIKELTRFNKVMVTTARNRTNNSTALHLAAAGGHKEVVQALIELGASPTDENSDGMTAIHLAAKHGHSQVLEALKGQMSWKLTSKKTGLTGLHVAAHFGQINFVREMLTVVPATMKSEPPNDETALTTSEFGLTPLHLAAQSGHEGLVRLLLNCPGVQADSPTNLQGTIPLHMAAQSGHASVVSLLLSKSTAQLHIKDKRGRTSLHLAAANGHYDMVTLLLGQGADINSCDKNGWTALHFASKAGYLNVVKLLVESGASPKFETKDGKVPICWAAAANHSNVLSYLMKKDFNTQQLMEDKKFVFDLMICGRLNDNKCIQEFILLSPAPVDTAAKMSRNFRDLATKEKERARDILAAATYCESMSTELLAIASGSSSAQHILKAVDFHGIPFLDVLIENEQKEVVAHPAVQKYLSDVWMGNLVWATWKIIMLFLMFLFIPIVWIIFSLPIKHRYSKVPIIKFMAYLVSHIYLMVLFCITVVDPIVPIYLSASLLPHWYEWLLLAWMSGLLVSELTNPGDRDGLGMIKVVVIGICAIGVFCHIIAFAFDETNRLVLLYIRNQFFAWALLLDFVLLLDFLSFHHLFGPWAIIIRDLMKDLTRFLVILLIFMLGFTLHLAAVYQPVFKPTELSALLGDGDGSAQTSAQTPIDTFEFLFFALFGLVEPDSLPPLHRSPLWVPTLVKIVFGTYMMVTLIVLINLLIAMMSDTYQRIVQQSDTEWKFGRAKLIRNMNRTSATPSPLNLFTKLFMYIKIAYKHRGKVCSTHADEYINEEEDMDANADSRSVDLLQQSSANWLRNVVRRNTQVAPDGGFLRNQVRHGPQRIEDVVDWEMVVKKYLVMQGLEEPEKTGFEDDKYVPQPTANGHISTFRDLTDKVKT